MIGLLPIAMACLIAAPMDRVEQQIAAAIAKLGDNAYRVREQGQRELLAIGPPALPALQVASNSSDPEVAKRANAIQTTIREREQAASGLHVIGVYEGSGDNRPGRVDVLIKKGDVPITLVLCAYEPVEWHVKVEDGTVITKVILSGYHKQRVIGVEAPVTSMSYDERSPGYFYAFERNSEEYPHLVKRLREITGKEIASFQGVYNPKRVPFVVGK